MAKDGKRGNRRSASRGRASDGFDWTVTLSIYTVSGRDRTLQDILTYKLGADDLLGTSDDTLTYVQSYNASNKIRFEENFDSDGRVILYRNLATGDELYYEYDDSKDQVTISSSGKYFKQVFQFDKSHPGDFVFSRLIEEERDGVKRVWDEDEQLISTTDLATGKEITTPSGRYVTSVTDKDGVTTFYQDGVILSVVAKDGTVLRAYTHFVDPATGELTDVDFEGKTTLENLSICLEGSSANCSHYRVIYENGIILEYQIKDTPRVPCVGRGPSRCRVHSDRERQDRRNEDPLR